MPEQTPCTPEGGLEALAEALFSEHRYEIPCSSEEGHVPLSKDKAGHKDAHGRLYRYWTCTRCHPRTKRNCRSYIDQAQKVLGREAVEALASRLFRERRASGQPCNLLDAWIRGKLTPGTVSAPSQAQKKRRSYSPQHDTCCYQIRLGEPSLIGFRACLDESRISQIEAKFGLSEGTVQDPARKSVGPYIYTSRFEPVIDLNALPNYSTSAAIDRVVLRNFLANPVKEQGCLRYGKAFDHYEIIPSDRADKVKVYFKDGSSDICDVLIGADGSSSQLGLRNVVDISSHRSFVGKGSLSKDTLNKLPQVVRSQPLMVWSKGTTFYYALYMPEYVGDKRHDNNELFDYEETEASIYWVLVLPREATDASLGTDKNDNRDQCLKFIRSWAPEFETMVTCGLNEASGGGVTTIPLRASERPSKTWRQDARQKSPADSKIGNPHVWLIGDAMHAMQPNRGMGGNQAMQDSAEALPALLKLASASTNPTEANFVAALQGYENGMIDRAFDWVEQSGGCAIPYVDVDEVDGREQFLKAFVSKH